MGNGLANIIAAAIVAGAIIWAGVVDKPQPQAVLTPTDEKAFAEWYARAVGDIKNDIVVNCGCCGEGEKKPGF